jgi:hypothetical protein
MPLVGIPSASRFLTGSFMAMALALAALLVLGVFCAGRRLGEPSSTTWRWTIGTAVAAVAWLGATWAAAETGLLSRLDVWSPPFMGLAAAIFVLGLLMAFTPLGTRLVDGVPLAALVAAQAFRFPLELLMHHAHSEGVMPYQMSYSGWNFDIITGLTALPVAWALHRGVGGRRLALVWNALGSLLLLNIVVIAIVSTPMVALFGPDLLNTWVMFPPFVWLPAVMVLMAFAGHLIIVRAIRRRFGTSVRRSVRRPELQFRPCRHRQSPTRQSLTNCCCPGISGDVIRRFLMPSRSCVISTNACSPLRPRSTSQQHTTVPVRPMPPQQCT